MQKNAQLQSCELIRDFPWELHVSHKNKAFKICCHYIFQKFLDCDWIWIGLSIHFEKWIWIDNHIFAMDLDWIDNPKKSD